MDVSCLFFFVEQSEPHAVENPVTFLPNHAATAPETNYTNS